MAKINVVIVCDHSGFPVNTGMVCEEAEFDEWRQQAAIHGGIRCASSGEKHGKDPWEYQKGLPVKEK